ncbi:MAG: SpoIIE family protein phosphatase [Planctomycetia bacterium]|nr:SpoIIE family protein phosphatase [Planctomycetia bacterium]
MTSPDLPDLSLSHLRVFAGPTGEAPASDALARLTDFCQAFEECTGWPLRYVPDAARRSDDAVWTAPLAHFPSRAGHFRLEMAPARKGAVADSHAAIDLATHWVKVLDELLRTQRALWEREAELAAGVPLVPHASEAKKLAERLESIVKSAAESAGCSAAALYLLSQDTTSLKLRASWKLPSDRLAAPPRPLADCMADVEAMSGHAVVIEGGNGQRFWQPPEDFLAAACVPVSSGTQIFGTLWVFDSAARPFSDQETNVLEIVAGRIAAELERAVLLTEAERLAKVKRDVSAAGALQHDELPTVLPPIEGWDLAGWSHWPSELGGAFYDWMLLDGGDLAVVVAHAARPSVEGAVLASSLRAMIRSHSEHLRDPAEILARVNRTLWTSSPGDKQAHALLAVLRLGAGQIRLAAAGTPALLRVGRSGAVPTVFGQPPLGASPAAAFSAVDIPLDNSRDVSELLVLAADGLTAGPQREAFVLADAHRDQLLDGPFPRGAGDLAGRLRRLGAKLDRDQAAVVLRRKSGS